MTWAAISGRDLALAVERVCRDHHAREAKHFEELGDRRDLVRLVLDRPLGEHEALLHGPSRDKMQGRGGRGSVEGAPERLTVQSNDALTALGKAAHEGQKTCLELRRIEQPKHARERVMAGDT